MAEPRGVWRPTVEVGRQLDAAVAQLQAQLQALKVGVRSRDGVIKKRKRTG